MRRVSYNKGFSLVEMLMAVAIVLVLLTLVIKVGGNLKEQAKCQLTGCTIEIIVDALTIYYDDHGQFPFERFDANNDGVVDAGDFGDVDGDGFFRLNDYLDTAPGFVVPVVYRSGTNTDRVDWSSQALYYYLAENTKARRLIEALATDMITGREGSGIAIMIERPSGSGNP